MYFLPQTWAGLGLGVSGSAGTPTVSQSWEETLNSCPWECGQWPSGAHIKMQPPGPRLFLLFPTKGNQVQGGRVARPRSCRWSTAQPGGSPGTLSPRQVALHWRSVTSPTLEHKATHPTFSGNRR